jgi:hypothetical protein
LKNASLSRGGGASGSGETGGWAGVERRLQLLGERPVMAEQDGARGGPDQVPILLRQLLAPQDEHLAVADGGFVGSARAGDANAPLEPVLQLVAVGEFVLVQDHQVDRQTLPAPVLVGSEELADDLPVPDLVDPREDDGPVSRNPVTP